MTDAKVPVTIKFHSPGAQPPIFVAGDFSEWQPLEMKYSTEDGEHEFYKELKVEANERFQYKFRLGPGDWWVLNESSTVVTDDAGNRNNLLVAPSVEEVLEKLENPGKSKKSDEPHASTGLDKVLEDSKLSDGTDLQVPVLVVAKADDEKSYGDDYGPNATSSQKEAHKKRALDAQPDIVVLGDDIDTTNYSATAAEVADLAAILDKEKPVVELSDEEAGRTGHRRLSTTPIPEVASTAAEVADSAAKLDLDDVELSNEASEEAADTAAEADGSAVGLNGDDAASAYHSGLLANADLQQPDLEHDSEDDSGAETPWEERVPLFPHERPDVFDCKETEPATPVLGQPRKMSIYEQEPIIDPEDPTLEFFPTERSAILQRIRTSSMSLSSAEDDSRRSPRAETTLKSPSQSATSRSSSRANAPTTPLLSIIKEERQTSEKLEEPESLTLPDAIQKGTTASSEGVLSESPSQSSSAQPEAQPSMPKLLSAEDLLTPATALPKVDNEETAANEPKIESPVDRVVVDEPSTTLGQSSPVPSLAKAISEPEDRAQDQTISGAFEQEEADNEEAQEVQMAALLPDTATTTAVASNTNGDSNSTLKSRAAEVQRDTARSPSPVSFKSPKDGEKSKSFLDLIWRTIFISWFGGLITKLCGGRRRGLTIAATIVLAAGSAAYVAKVKG